MDQSSQGMEKKTPHELIIQMLKEKACMKQDVFKITIDTFNVFKYSLKKIVDDLSGVMKTDSRISLEFKTKNEFNAEIKIAGDTLIFQVHTNVFHFDKSHHIWNSSYVREDHHRAYCGMINVYNFLSDSIKYNRESDVGYLVGRIFINKEKHFFVEGKRQLGFLYNNFPNSVIDDNTIHSIIESAILYCLDFDLLTPSYDTMKEVSVQEIQELIKNLVFSTGKRLGFKFQADSDNIE